MQTHPPHATPAIAELSPYNQAAFAPFTFPKFQNDLLDPAKRASTIAVGAWLDNHPMGLALTTIPPRRSPNLLSIFVDPAARRSGIGTRLLQATADGLRRRGIYHLTATHRTTLPDLAAFEALLAACGWTPPRLRMLVLEAKFTQIVDSPFMRTPPPLDADFEILSWSDVRPAEIEKLGAAEQFSVEVWPLNFGPDYHRETSVGVRHRGELVGWVVNHAQTPPLLRFTTSYLRDDLQRRGRFAAVLAESVWRMRGTPYTHGIWTCPVEFPRMLVFARKRLAPFCYRTSETRGSAWEFEADPATNAPA